MRLPSVLGWPDRQPLANPSRHSHLRRRIAVLALGAALLAACEPAPGANPAIRLSLSPAPARLAAAPIVCGDPEAGRKLFTGGAFYPGGCGGCHTLNGYTTGAFPGAPNLTNVSLRPTLAGETIQNNPSQMKAWIMDPPSQKQGAKMPKLPNLTDQEATDLAAFLYSLPYNPPQ
jgi:mono/diheme cytochrome c family protein